MTLELLPIDIDALEEEMEGNQQASETQVTTSNQPYRSQKEAAYEVTKVSGEEDSMAELKRMPRRLTLPEVDSLEDLPHPHFPAPVNINSLTVKAYHSTKPKFNEF